MKDLTLVIMAAGMGSRFGGLKQITPIDENGNFIIDYSIYDAKKAGFNKVVFIVKEDNLNDFKETVGKRVENHIKVEYAIQDMNNVPGGFTINPERVKPLGTVHAVLAAEPFVKENFAIINADDFYGFDTYKKIADFFNGERNENEFVMVPYPFVTTKSDFGSVKRGVCDIENGYIKNIIEAVIETVDGKYMATPQKGGDSFEIEPNQAVSMNVFGVTPAYFKNMNQYMIDFLSELDSDNLTGETLIAECLKDDILSNTIKMKAISSESVWLGMTNREDLEIVKTKINELVTNGEYPANLWN